MGCELWSEAFAFHCLPHSSARSWLQGEPRFKGLCSQGPLHSRHSFLPAAGSSLCFSGLLWPCEDLFQLCSAAGPQPCLPTCPASRLPPVPTLLSADKQCTFSLPWALPPALLLPSGALLCGASYSGAFWSSLVSFHMEVLIPVRHAVCGSCWAVDPTQQALSGLLAQPNLPGHP